MRLLIGTPQARFEPVAQHHAEIRPFMPHLTFVADGIHYSLVCESDEDLKELKDAVEALTEIATFDKTA